MTIVNAGPQGEVATLAEANEVRVVFSEPMVTLGRIPARVTPPFFKISPSVPGTFRWSGTTILIFTPDPKRPLPYATRYEITINASATAVSGRKLAKPMTFSFTTPTVKLLETKWYRRGNNISGRTVIALRFNQPVKPADVAAHVSAALEPHKFAPPSFTAEEQARLKTVDPQSLEQFAAKVAATRVVASSSAAVPLKLTSDWDRKRFPPSRNLVVLETAEPLAPESWVKVTADPALPSPAGRQTPGQPQAYTIQAEQAFFVDGFYCAARCNPDGANPIQMRREVKVTDFSTALSAADITAATARPVAKPARPKPRREYESDESASLTLEDAGFDAQPPNRKYAVTARADLESVDGQTLGYTWLGVVENWHQTAFTSFGDGHGVWETGGGPLLPFYSRNFTDVRQWVSALRPDQLMPTILQLQEKNFGLTPPGAGTERKLPVTADRIQSHGIDLSSVLRPGGTGLVWAGVREGQPIARSHRYRDDNDRRTRATIVQVTNLGITVKDSPHNTLIFVTRLDTGAPVQGASVSIVRLDNRVFWRGTTGADGIALAPDTPLRDGRDWWKFAFIVTAEKDGDVAYVGSNWNEGITPWELGTGINLNEAAPLLRGSVFTDRGVYRLGEEVHAKAILRHNTPDGVRLLAAGSPVHVTVYDSHARVVDRRTVKLGAWSSADWTFTLPADGALGDYSIRANEPNPRAKPDGEVPYYMSVNGGFLVAAYRRPDFRVDVSLTGETAQAGDPLKGIVTARYLFGAPMGARPVSWRFTRSPSHGAPNAVREAFPDERWVFVGWPERDRDEPPEIRREEQTLGKTGELPIRLDTKRDAGWPYVYTLEADVEDVSRQHIANRASITVHPAPWYIGVHRPSYFLDQKTGLRTQVIAAGVDGRTVSNVPVEITLTQIQWVSVRQSEGSGFYAWQSERKEVAAGSWKVTTAAEPVALEVPFQNGGYFVLRATARTADGRVSTTTMSFYVLGDGYTAWARYDHNRIDLVADKRTYKPGETARIMIQSPWEQATAVVTTEREGIRTYRQFALTSTQQSVPIPVAEEHIPNVFVSVLLVKGRTTTPSSGASGPSAVDEPDPSDPGKPSFRLGYVELEVEDQTKRLSVAVAANKQEYRPANMATVRLDVKDHQGRGTPSEVTLWAVDYGVLSLTSYRTPDVLRSVYVRKALQVMNVDSRQRIISRRVLTPKGDAEGGGGGAEAGAGTLRKDFRVVAFWLGSVTTDAEGHAAVDVKLPVSLTTYRIMAVAGDRGSRFGSGDSEVRINKPVTLKPTFPRFLAVGDKAMFGAVITSQLPSAGAATVTIRSLDPAILEFAPGPVVQPLRAAPAGGWQQTLNVAAGGSVEARFEAAGKAIGRARVQMTVKIGVEADAFEDVIPVEVLASPETVAAYGEAADSTTMTEKLTVPRSVVPGFGGLHVEMSSTAMVGLGEGARYLVEYPYGCAEQKGSRALALLLAADLGDAFSLPGLDTAKMKPAVQSTLKELERFQCDSGGFAYWAGDCRSVSPYLTSYLLHVFQVASDLKYEVDPAMRARALTYLERQLATKPPVNEIWWTSYTSWQAFSVKVLVEGGRNADSHINRLYGHRDRMPVFALAYLHDALTAKGESTGERIADLRRRMANAILPEGGSAHVEELNDPYLDWLWSSNVRSTAIVLNSLVRAGVTDVPFRGLVRWMMTARKNGRWGNTQENAHAMEALVAYYRRYEATVPEFTAVVKAGDQQLARETFKGRSTEAKAADVPMARVLETGAAGTSRPLTFAREGAGTLFYTARLRYAADELYQQGLDAGFHVERTYSPFVEKGNKPAATSFKAGDLVRVTLTFRLTKERRFVAVTDPLPAGFEAIESWFATTQRELAEQQDRQRGPRYREREEGEWDPWWLDGGFDHVERHDDRIVLFATMLSEGRHEFSYVVRATTAGMFRTAPAHAEEMYEPEVFGRTATAVIEVKR